jgi:methyltransferase (TIGR00027 family)
VPGVARVLPNQRARFVDEEVERAIGEGITQYVILGAGLDSFAWRRPDLMSAVELFEVDHSVTQEWKRKRMWDADLLHPTNLHFVGMDFEAQQRLAVGLRHAGFDSSQSSIWSWMGVAVYLGPAAITSVLRDTAQLAGSGSRFLASYTVVPRLMDQDPREFSELARSASAESGEDQVSAFVPEEIEAIVLPAGWYSARSVDPSSFQAWFSQRRDALRPAPYEWLLVADS